ncbi:MAG: hypothetical protein ACRC5M_04655 [Anaeroplasmataceae bacterium]
MEKLLNADGTISFTNISELRTNFEKSFAKKQLGMTMKEIVHKCAANIPSVNSEDSVTADNNVRRLISSTIADVADKSFTNAELNGNTYMGGLKGIIVEYAGMEADYRESVANSLLSTKSNKIEASQKIMDLFSIENLDFMSKDIKKSYLDELEYKFGGESVEVVTTIGKVVGEAIAEAENKNLIINETHKVIQEQRDEIRKEMEIDDEENEEKSGDDEEFDDSEDTGEEPGDDEGGNDEGGDDDLGGDDEEDSDGEIGSDEDSDSGSDDEGEDEKDSSDDEEGKENFNYGEEVFMNAARKAEVRDIVKKDGDKLIKKYTDNLMAFQKDLKKFADKYNTRETEYDHAGKGKPVEVKYSDAEIKEIATDFAKRAKSSLISGKTYKQSINIGDVRGIHIAKQIISFIIDPLILYPILVLTDKDEQAARDTINGLKNNKDKSLGVVKLSMFGGRTTDKARARYHITIVFKIKPSDIYKAKGVEDADVSAIEISLKGKLDTEIEAGNITIGTPNLDLTTVDLDNHEPMGEPLPSKSNDFDELSSEALEYRKLLYGNENMSKTIVPLSPTKLDSIDLPSPSALGVVYAKSTESLNNLKEVIESRLNVLGEIVQREQDEELTKKYDQYKERALEGFEYASVYQLRLNNLKINPFGLEDVNDPLNLYIGNKAYQFLNGKLKLKNREAKLSYESFKDGVDAAFDISILKDAARSAENYDDLINIKQELQSREDLFWANIVDLNTDEEKKTQIKDIIQLGDLDIDNKIIVDNEFRSSIKLALDTQKVVGITKSENEIHEEIYDKAKTKIESFLGKDLSSDQLDIVKGMINGTDVSDFAPTPFEKFVIKLGTDKAVVKNGGKDFELGQEDAKEVTNKAIALCVLEQFVNMVKPMNEHDTKEFNRYINS